MDSRVKSQDRKGGGRSVEGEDDRPILYFGNVPFASAWQRSQQIVTQLASSVPVVYVDPNRSLLQALRKKAPQATRHVELPERLQLFQPPAGLPLARSLAVVNRLNYSATSNTLKRYLKRANAWPPKAVIATFPDQMEVVRFFRDVLVIYDLMDEPLLFAKPRQKANWAGLHEELLERADLTVTSSRVLYRRYAPRTRAITCITNGVSDYLFESLNQATAHAELSRLPGPRFGYVGMVSHWFDFEAVIALAKAFPQGTVVLVGPTDCRLPALPGNVVMTGPVPHHDLAPVLKSFDIGMIPFRRCSAIDAVNPVKLYEYLAAGLPVLSASFSEMAEFGSLVALYDDTNACVEQARSLLGFAGSVTETSARRSFAEQHTWSNKAKQYLQAVRELLHAMSQQSAA